MSDIIERLRGASLALPGSRECGLEGNEIDAAIDTIARLRSELEEARRDAAFDFLAHLRRQAEFSARTFGPGARVQGVTDHIAKELHEVRESGGSLAEWVDVIILALDGAWRSGASPEEIVAAIVAKQTKNEGRKWPDWRTADPNKAIEHDRSQDAAIAAQGAAQ